MYLINYGAQAVYDPRVDDKTVLSASSSLYVGQADALSFKLTADHPVSPSRMSGTVEMLEDDEILFRGRVTKVTQDIYKNRSYQCEGALAYLNDSIIEPFGYPDDAPGAEEATNIVEHFLGWLLTQHNLQVENDRKILLGTVTVTDPNNYIARSNEDYASTLETIKAKITDSFGGYLCIRYEANATYLDYFSTLPTTNTQKVQFAKNLLDIANEEDGSQLFTQIVPIGADGLTIGEEPDGAIDSDLVKSGDMIYSTSGRAAVGKIAKVVNWDDVTIGANLKTKAADYLRENGLQYPKTVTIKAADLSFDGETPFRVGKNTVVLSDLSGVEVSYPLMSMSLNLLRTGLTEITLGSTAKSMIGSVQSAIRKISEKEAADNAARKRDDTSHDQAQLALNQQIMNSLGFRVTDIAQPDGGVVRYYHDAATLADSTIIYTMTANGFAWTTNWNGGNPTWQYGITKDGNAVLNRISALKISADDVTTGSIKSQNYAYTSGNFSSAGAIFDLSDGMIRTKNLYTKGDALKLKGEINTESPVEQSYLPSDYSSSDLDRIDDIIAGRITPTTEDYNKYALWHDNSIDSDCRYYIRLLASLSAFAVVFLYTANLGDRWSGGNGVEVRATVRAYKQNGTVEQSSRDLFTSGADGTYVKNLYADGIYTGGNNFLPLRYIKEQGTSNGWDYRKWSDGVLEQWASLATVIGGWASWGSLYASSSRIQGTFGIPFVGDRPKVTCSLNIDAQNSMLLISDGHPTITQTQGFQIACVNTGAGGTTWWGVDVYAIGRWN